MVWRPATLQLFLVAAVVLVVWNQFYRGIVWVRFDDDEDGGEGILRHWPGSDHPRLHRPQHQRPQPDAARVATTSAVTSTSSSSEPDHLRLQPHGESPLISSDKSHQGETSQTLSPLSVPSLWNSSDFPSIPPWMAEYMDWHRHARHELDAWVASDTTQRQDRSDSNHRLENLPPLLILQCTSSQPKCGGLADRLKPLPLLLLGASKSHRLFLIRWSNDRPANLEEFLLPPPHGGGLDWRVPESLGHILDGTLADQYDYSHTHIANVKPFMNILMRSNKVQVVTTTLQWWDGGEQAYKDALQLKNQKDDEFRRIYHDVFRLCFVPTLPIQKELDRIYATTPLGVQRPQQSQDDGGSITTSFGPTDYVAAHYRALWWEDQTPPSYEEQVATAQNAVNCASRLGNDASPNSSSNNHNNNNKKNRDHHRKHRPIYFATDSLTAQQIVQDYAVTKNLTRTIVIVPHRRLVHLDRVRVVMSSGDTASGTYASNDPTAGSSTTATTTINQTTKVDVSVQTVHGLDEIYPIFVDLFLLANSRCVAFGDGGYGQFGLMISRQQRCSFRHIRRHNIQRCDWVD